MIDGFLQDCTAICLRSLLVYSKRIHVQAPYHSVIGRKREEKRAKKHWYEMSLLGKQVKITISLGQWPSMDVLILSVKLGLTACFVWW